MSDRISGDDGGAAGGGGDGGTGGDRVVRELDVYVCNGILGASTSLYLFQYPLRPPWRPYGEDHDTEAIRYKPGVGRVEMDVPLETTEEQFNESCAPHMKRRQHSLSSARVDLRTTYALGSVRGDKVLLCQLDDAVQMRPSLAHLDDADAKDGKGKAKAAAAEEAEQPENAELKVLKVQVQRRETERQQEMRMQSHAYLREQEEKEPWLPLTNHPVDSYAAEKIWEQLMTPGGEVIEADVTCQEYLQAIVPHAMASQSDSPEAVGDAMEVDPIQTDSAQAFEVTEDMQAALPQALYALFRHHNVCSLDNIRKWLANFPEAGAASQLGTAPDPALHSAIIKCSNIRGIRGSYLLAATGAEDVDKFREVLLGLLLDKPQVKRSEIKDAVKEAKLEFGDTMLTKVLKSICMTRGNGWCLKSGI